MTICRHAKQCHYQILFRDLLEVLSLHPETVDVLTYWPNADHDSSFVCVRNSVPSYWTENIDWEGLEDVYSFATNNCMSSIQQQKLFADFGFTTSMCTTRTNSLSGVATPMLKNGTTTPKVLQCFKILNNVSEDVKLPWVMKSGKRLFHDKQFPHHHDKFASTIFENNKIEYIRVNDTHLSRQKGETESLCKPHNDSKTNSPESSMSTIINVSKLVKNGTTRRNIGCAQ